MNKGKNRFLKPEIFKLKNTKDKRGTFSKILSHQNNNRIFKNDHILEVNISENKKKGTVRGFHFQIGKFKEKKLIYCLKGKILDISININKKSKNYLKIYKQILNEKDNKLLYIPEDFAHGYQTLSKNTVLLYLHSKPYKKKYQRSINPINNFFKIQWPLPITNISKKDKYSK